jgi:DegV family protein with EDD domain
MAASRPVAIVTDSTADLPADVANRLGVTVVPLTVRFGQESFLDGVELSPAAFLQRLTTSAELPKTSQPTVAAFDSAFRRLVESDHDVLCITIASKLSGTHNAARLAAEAVPSDRIRVLDSGATAMQQGIVILEAIDAVEAGGSLEQVRHAAVDAIARTQFLVALDTLDYVYRGGRIGKAAHLMGSVLAIKPLLTFRDGEVQPLERARTWRKALTRLVELAEAAAPIDRLLIGHAGNASDALELKRRLEHLVPPDKLLIAEAGPVLLTYSGPGAVAVAALRSNDRNGRSSTLEPTGE